MGHRSSFLWGATRRVGAAGGAPKRGVRRAMELWHLCPVHVMRRRSGWLKRA
ncbi:hypothetical protein F750_5417 [Streptomyces sp. PAMC 26508]|nr:hypothetical protein F750_5417 [Streptomyces sp. PAMC 26508]